MKCKWIQKTHLSLCDQFTGIELGDNSLQHFRGDRWQHTFIIILTENGVDSWQLIGHRSEQNTQCDVNILQIFAASYHRYVAWLRANVKNDRPLDPWNEKMCALADDTLFNTLETIEDNRSVATIDCEW